MAHCEQYIFAEIAMKVSIVNIIKSDYLTMLFVIAPVITIVLFIDATYFGFLHELFSRGGSSGSVDSSHKSAFVRSLAQRQKISVVVSKNNHAKRLIKGMYVNEWRFCQ